MTGLPDDIGIYYTWKTGVSLTTSLKRPCNHSTCLAKLGRWLKVKQARSNQGGRGGPGPPLFGQRVPWSQVFISFFVISSCRLQESVKLGILTRGMRHTHAACVLWFAACGMRYAAWMNPYIRYAMRFSVFLTQTPKWKHWPFLAPWPLLCDLISLLFFM